MGSMIFGGPIDRAIEPFVTPTTVLCTDAARGVPAVLQSQGHTARTVGERQDQNTGSTCPKCEFVSLGIEEMDGAL